MPTLTKSKKAKKKDEVKSKKQQKEDKVADNKKQDDADDAQAYLDAMNDKEAAQAEKGDDSCLFC